VTEHDVLVGCRLRLFSWLRSWGTEARRAAWWGRDFRRGQSAEKPSARAAEVVPGGRPDRGWSASEPDQLVGPGIVPMPSIAFVNSIG
jgi:hypothetical protein